MSAAYTRVPGMQNTRPPAYHGPPAYQGPSAYEGPPTERSLYVAPPTQYAPTNIQVLPRAGASAGASASTRAGASSGASSGASARIQVLPRAGASALAKPDDRPAIVVAAEQALADPAARDMIKQQAVKVGGQVVVVARHYGAKGLAAFNEYVQQGPRGISTLCFIGGVVTSILGCMSVSNFFGTVMDPLHYILGAYMFVFGLATACLEADTDRLGVMITPIDKLAEPVTRAQAWLHDEVRLLTELRGRGLFYLYQGTLMMSQCVFCLLFLGGVYNLLMGLICLGTACGLGFDLECIYGCLGFAPPDVERAEGGGGTIVLDERFPSAQRAWNEVKPQLSGKVSRELWALHEQATVGDCNQPKPEGMFNGNAKEQWRLWRCLEGISQNEAKLMFIELLERENIL